MPYLVAWTVVHEDTLYPKDELYLVVDTRAGAETVAKGLSARDDVLSWVVACVLGASEPEWVSNPNPKLAEVKELKEQGR
jgi:hypothetical protein